MGPNSSPPSGMFCILSWTFHVPVPGPLAFILSPTALWNISTVPWRLLNVLGWLVWPPSLGHPRPQFYYTGWFWVLRSWGSVQSSSMPSWGILGLWSCSSCSITKEGSIWPLMPGASSSSLTFLCCLSPCCSGLCRLCICLRGPFSPASISTLLWSF